jgi:hypothetical protein
MKKQGPSDSEKIGDLQQKIIDLESRVSRLEEVTTAEERMIAFRPRRQPGQTEDHDSSAVHTRQEAIESRIGEYGMAWMGNIVLLFGFLFLTQYLQNINYTFISLAFGFLSVILVYLAAHFTRNTLHYMSMLFNYNGHLLLYIQVMRVCMFKESMIIQNPYLGHALVLVVLISLTYLAYRRNSQVLAVLVWIMMSITAITSGNTHFMLPLMAGITGTGIIYVLKKRWWTNLTISIFIAYFIYLAWVTGNPFTGGGVAIRTEHQFGYLYLFAIAIAYSFLALLPQSETTRQKQLQPAIVLNGLGFSLMMVFTAPAFFTANFYVYFGIIAAFCLLFSIWIQIRGNWNTIAAMYALYSFVSLSITIVGIYHFPLAFFLLSIQSLLVVSMALWFRSRFIVVMNTILFLGLLLTYFIIGDPLNSINFSFALVALITARILNWKKQRLEIRTEWIRNIFLFTGAIMVLFSLHKAVPANFITLSWALTAVVFFLLSVVIRNMKYRWLAIITMVLTVFYLFIVDLDNISLGYRLVALMFISTISLGISMFYSRKQRNKQED